MQIANLSLTAKTDLVTILPDTAVSKAVVLLNQHNIGALPVCDSSGSLIGIVSERDIVRGLSEGNVDLDKLIVEDLMTANVITCSSEDDIEDIMAVMDGNHIRHIPVMGAEGLSTMISSRDVMAAALAEAKTHVNTLSLAYEMVR